MKDNMFENKGEKTTCAVRMRLRDSNPNHQLSPSEICVSHSQEIHVQMECVHLLHYHYLRMKATGVPDSATLSQELHPSWKNKHTLSQNCS